MVAVAAAGRLELLDLATCRATALANVSATDVRFSPDGGWVAFSRVGEDGTPPAGLFVVSVHGGRVRAPLGVGVEAWSWAPEGDRLYGVTSDGSLVSASPTGERRTVTAGLGRITATGFGLVFGLSPDGDRAAVDSSCSPHSPGGVDLIDLRTGARTVIVPPRDRVMLAGFSPDGRWLLFWPDELCSGSLAADGTPLDAVAATGGRPVTAVKHMLLYPDFISWCGRRLVAAAGPSRETQLDSKLVATGPPTWRRRTIEPASKLSWVSPVCAPARKLIAAAAGANVENAGFGDEHRSIWLLRPNGAIVRRLTQPPEHDLSDEAPRFSRDGRWILFVRSRVILVGTAATSRDTLERVPVSASGAAPVSPIVSFSSNDFSYYDHFDWPSEIDWYQPG